MLEIKTFQLLNIFFLRFSEKNAKINQCICSKPLDYLFSPTVPAYTPTTSLRLWHEKNHRWLELSDVHRETTEDIRVTVIPFYMGSRVSELFDFSICYPLF